MKKPNRSYLKLSPSSILLIIAFIVGLSIFSYPIITQIYSSITQTRVIDTYQDSLDQLSEDDINTFKDQIAEYNESLNNSSAPQTYKDPFDESKSNQITAEESRSSFNVFTESLGQTLGYINIPAIDGNFPIYAGTSDAVLQKGIGHMENTSFPMGGKSTHAVLTGHRGLPTSKLFTDLPDMELGNVFYLNILDETLAYEVTEINTVLPYETELISIQEDRDLVTLITCTPYMINTHRLLVMGERIPYTPEEPVAAAVPPSIQEEKSYILPITVGTIFGILSISLIIYKRSTRKEDIE
ncbi:class C sortase [Alkalibacterium kapii]|uniref:Class C sortase n=1 Tax=Alkalibacterium kapii TaxID=426704 RepID=A0A511ARV5_9LACT|nr:class C sortase [Alkalibacterium kapii]GEK90826.1 class C sortase [Alkalibacterium kapii]